MFIARRNGVHPPSTVEEMQSMIQSVPAQLWGGGDGGFPIDMGDGRVFWVYGDSYTDYANGGWSFFHSTAHLLQGGRFHICNKGKPIVPNHPDGDYYWPSGGCRVGPNKVLITSGRIHTEPDNSWGGVGQESAYFNVTPSGDLVFDRWLTYWPDYETTGITYGEPLVNGSDLVVFGWGNSEVKGRRLFVAKVPLDQVETESAWTFYPSALRYEAEAGLCCSAWNDGGRWRVMTHETFFSHNVYVYESTSLEGPWTRRIGAVTPKIHGSITYVPHWHPEIKLDNGKIPITVSRQTSIGPPYESRLWAMEVTV